MNFCVPTSLGVIFLALYFCTSPLLAAPVQRRSPTLCIPSGENIAVRPQVSLLRRCNITFSTTMELEVEKQSSV
ncbi:hypothetical protein L228DRAFT_246092 [Xylona heveae TC161]|uniref:Secreted protein n=1 Tax=Xylona heveae (strain CBS 132557 / TC161) TaxID=1328760 RepID=A0A165HD65_XYLHT|nr:hypothetical protein L228DRAFT_246092 [Xylona heveae TC161]KZF23330.1 hypothetical protein L228DRAFT_246092 [Xylona heveae TC161]